MFRYIIGIPIAVAVTLSLFFLMRYLVTSDYTRPEEVATIGDIDINREKRDEEVRLDEPDKARPKIKETPPPPPKTTSQRRPPKAQGLDINLSGMGGVEIDANSNFRSDADVQPIVRVPPQYPVRALERGVEGWVLVEFEITEIGTVENPVVLDADPPNIFNRAATKAVVKWKYKPRLEDGKAVRWKDKVVLTFELEQD
jgi:protein TonB